MGMPSSTLTAVCQLCLALDLPQLRVGVKSFMQDLVIALQHGRSLTSCKVEAKQKQLFKAEAPLMVVSWISHIFLFVDL